MRCLLLLVVPLADIKSLVENYIDLRIQSLELMEAVKTTERIQELDYCDIPTDTCSLVPVSLPKNNGTVFAKVSPEDYETITNASSKWRLCYSGYPIYVTRKNDIFTTTYMHKLVHGGSAKHINGDRLDNRRENLIDSPRGPPAPRKNKTGESEEDFKISTPKFLTYEVCSFRHNDQDLKLYDGFACVRYPRNKVYKGDVCQGIPNGYGHLYEGDHNIESCGMWTNGKMDRGMVINFKESSKCECYQTTVCPLREVIRVDVVESGHRK